MTGRSILDNYRIRKDFSQRKRSEDVPSFIILRGAQEHAMSLPEIMLLEFEFFLLELLTETKDGGYEIIEGMEL